MRLLLAESHRALAEVMRLFFAKTGAEVRLAPAVEPCLAELAGWQPDVLILDWSLAGGGGREVLQHVAATQRGLARTVPRPIVVPTLTGKVPRELSGALAEVVTVSMLKPFSLRYLLRVIEEVDRSRHAPLGGRWAQSPAANHGLASALNLYGAGR